MTAASHHGDWPPGAWNEAVERPAIGATRWGGSLALALGAHAAAALAMVAWHVPLTPLAADPPAVLLELAPLPVAPPEPIPVAEVPPAPPPPPEPVVEPPPEPPPPDPVVEPPPPPDPIVEPPPPPEPPPPEPPPVVEPEVVLPKPPPDPPKPKPEPKKETPKPQPDKPKPEKPKPPRPTPPTPTAAPPVAAPAPVAAAPAPSTAPARVSPSWQGRVLSHLERYKRYPRAAQARRQEGVAQVRFTIDREGRVLAVKLDRSAGHDLLDEETLEMVRRASPLPPPPDEMTQERIELVVPVQFFLK